MAFRGCGRRRPRSLRPHPVARGIVGLAAGLVAALVVAGRARPRMLALVSCLAGGLGYYVAYKPAQGVFHGGSSAGGTELRTPEPVAGGSPCVGRTPDRGVGLGNYSVAEPTYAIQPINLTQVYEIVNEQLVVHNTYLQLAAELGLVGLGLFLTILAMPLRLAGRALVRLERAHHELEFHVRGLLAGTIGMLVAYAFLSAEFEKPLWLVLGLLASVPTLLRYDTTE